MHLQEQDHTHDVPHKLMEGPNRSFWFLQITGQVSTNGVKTYDSFKSAAEEDSVTKLNAASNSLIL